MAEIGIDISNQTSNTFIDFENYHFDYIATLCDNARENCPYVPSSALKIHQHFEDLSNIKGTEEEKLNKYRRLREEARIFAHKFSKVHFKGLR